MRARESQLASELFGDDLEKVLPVVRPGGVGLGDVRQRARAARARPAASLPHAVMMMVPEAWEERDDLPEHLRAFYAFHSCVMEPWDGPAAISFTDGRVIGATLDRNGLRPGRWMETKRRLGRARLGDRRARRAAREHRCARAACSPASCSWSTSPRAASWPTRRSRRRSPTRRARTASGTSEGVVRLDDLPERQAASRASRCARASSRSATRRRTCASCSRRWPRRARSRSARWATTSRSRCSPTRRRRCSPTSSSSSRRSRTRRSTRSASRS